MESELADLLGSLAALGRSLGDEFDPQRFLGDWGSSRPACSRWSPMTG